jgi:hypothetical protein
LTAVLAGLGLSCTYLWDLTADLVQSGSTLTGTGTSVGRGIDCSVPLPPNISAIFNGQSGSGTLTGTANAGAVSFRVGELAFTGTYTSSRLDATAIYTLEGVTVTYTWRQTKQ